MQLDTCTQLLNAIRQALDYLFDDFGFSVLAVERARTGGRCLIVLSSRQCRFKITFNRGDLEIDVGSPSASISWEDTLSGVRQWYPLRSVLVYVRVEKYPDLDSLLKPKPFLTLEQQLNQMASDLKPDCIKVINLFQAESFTSRQRDLEQFLRERGEHIEEQLTNRYTSKRPPRDSSA